MLSVNEKSPVFMTLEFKDENGDPLIPTTVDWRLDDKTKGVEVVGWTSLPSPAATMTFTIPGSDNTIDDEVNVAEVMTVGIRVDNGLAGEGYSELQYTLINLTGPTGA